MTSMVRLDRILTALILMRITQLAVKIEDALVKVETECPLGREVCLEQDKIISEDQ